MSNQISQMLMTAQILRNKSTLFSLVLFSFFQRVSFQFTDKEFIVEHLKNYFAFSIYFLTRTTRIIAVQRRDFWPKIFFADVEGKPKGILLQRSVILKTAGIPTNL